VFGGDGDIFSIGGNHLQHTARKNIKLTLVVMDNWVYGLTKKQTSPTSPLGFKSKTDVWGAVESEAFRPARRAPHPARTKWGNSDGISSDSSTNPA
jgi:2-oxoglutarate ferredoxin oxidoreductase subunit beta